MILLFATCGCTRGTSSPTRLSLSLSVVGGEQTLVVPQPGNRYGFEGGEVIRVGATYYWFTTELTALPYWAKTTLALWTSADGQHWHRQATLFGPSSADQTGNDRRAALWAPIPVYDQNDHHWLIFYISYRSKPDLVNYDGEVWEAKSTIAGSSGISGPYIDVGVVFRSRSARDSHGKSFKATTPSNRFNYLTDPGGPSTGPPTSIPCGRSECFQPLT